jgi:hypothetical protein
VILNVEAVSMVLVIVMMAVDPGNVMVLISVRVVVVVGQPALDSVVDDIIA